MKQITLLLGCVFVLGLFSCKTTVEETPTNDEDVYILVNGSETMTSLEVGQEYILRLSNSSSATWAVNNAGMATLSASSGVSVNLSARSAGNVTVTATVNDKTYTCALQIKKSSDSSGGNPSGGETNAPNVSFTNLSAYKVIVCRDGLSAEIATIEAGGTKSVYVSPGANEITFHFRYSYCIIADDDNGTIWMDVADNGAYTYPVDSADIAHDDTVQIHIPAPKNPQFNAAYLKIENQSAQPVSLYNGNTQQKLYNQEKYYIQPGHSGVYSIPPDTPFQGFTLGASPSSATAIAPFYVVSGVLYTCEFTEAGLPIDVREEIRLGEAWAGEPCTVTFEANGGTVFYPIEARLLEEVDMPKPTRQGYSFVGWYIDSELQDAIVYPYMVTADITLYAKWAENDTTYTVCHYKQNIDRISYTLEKTETLTGTTGATSDAVAMTYIGFTADLFEQVPVSADGMTVIDIYYDRNKYTVTFNANDGTDDTETQTFYYGITEKLKDNVFSNPGYTFLGWVTFKTGNPVYDNEADFLIDRQNPSDITLYAVWFHSITVTADTAGSIDLSDITDDYTIKVVGNISQITLQMLADKMKTTKASINLDLSEATGLTTISGIRDLTSSGSTSIFAGCPMNSIALPETLEVIGNYTFANCSIKTVKIPSSMQTIGNYAFSNCSNLEAIEIDGAETVCYICNYAFVGCESLSSVTMKSIGSIGEQTFVGCKNLSSVIMESIGSIGEQVFRDCINLSSVTMESIDTIGNYAFKDCTNLSSVIMKSIGTVGRGVFMNCASLSFITIDAESIGSNAFSGCISLTGVVIGKNVKSIDNSGYDINYNYGCFGGCSQLVAVWFEDTEDWYGKSSGSYSYKVDVTNAAENVCNLKDSYYSYLWYKN